MPGIFINYRNIDRSYAPVLIDRELGLRFGAQNVFLAGRSTPPGTSFPDKIMRRLASCTLLIALIDPPWAGADLELLQDPGDWVRREISYAVEHGKEILPVLLDGAVMPSTNQVPDDVAPMTKRIALSMRARTAGTDLMRLVREVERLVPDLVLATLTDPPPGPPPTTVALLRAEYEVYPPRERPELDQLAGWATGGANPRARLVTGASGAGKTRLGLQLSARLRELGWQAGLISPSAPAAALDRLADIRAPLLVVIDDADRRRTQVEAALRALAQAPDSAARLLLLSRSGGDWLDVLRRDRDDRLWALIDGISEVRLAPLAPAEEDFGLVYARFARWFADPVPPPADPPQAATMLELQAEVLGRLDPPRGAGAAGQAGATWRRMLDVERGYWTDRAATLGLTLSQAQLSEVMAAVTLFGASEEHEAETLIRSLRTFQGRPSDADACLDLVRAVLPGPAPLNSFQPERLGEDLVAVFLRQSRDWAGIVASVSDQQAERAIVTLGRCLDRYCDLVRPVSRFLGYAPGRLLVLAIGALPVVARPELLAQSMSQALPSVPESGLDRIVSALWQRSDVLAEFAVAVTERAWQAARHSARDEVKTARLARLFATRLAYLGERQTEAAQAARTAVDRLTVLADRHAADRPDLVAELAEAHAALALALDLDPGSAAEAIAAGAAAVASYHAILAEIPADERVSAALATALNNQSIRLRRDNRLEAALEAAISAYELTRKLQGAKPASFRSLHADIADNLSTLLQRCGRPAEAERISRKALAQRRTLAAARPDAYRPQLAATLFNLGLILQNEGRTAEVRELWTESDSVYAALADGRPDRFGAVRARVRDRLAALGPGPGPGSDD
ncbi:MAG TPA: TIR domain-containing protein [Streptosporangiaceae bacterium]|nr:TIR domain-containing protein [Streptosporangiaceae bacterium]